MDMVLALPYAGHRSTTFLAQQDQIADCQHVLTIDLDVFYISATKNYPTLSAQAVSGTFPVRLMIAREDCYSSRVPLVPRHKEPVVAHLNAIRHGCQVNVELVRMIEAREIRFAVADDAEDCNCRIGVAGVAQRDFPGLQRVDDHGVQEG